MDVLLFIKAFIISIIEGITEFLPISSTGYMVLSADIINFWDKDKRDLFIVFVQIGAILAVIYDYWGRLWTAFMGLITGRADGMTNPRRLGISLIITTIPVMIVGLTLEDFITGTLFHPLVVATMLIIGALLIIYVEKHPRPIKAQEAEQINFKTALKIGLCQCLALIPGTSRSGATIIGALWRRNAGIFCGCPTMYSPACGVGIHKRLYDFCLFAYHYRRDCVIGVFYIGLPN